MILCMVIVKQEYHDYHDYCFHSIFAKTSLQSCETVYKKGIVTTITT